MKKYFMLMFFVLTIKLQAVSSVYYNDFENALPADTENIGSGPTYLTNTPLAATGSYLAVSFSTTNYLSISPTVWGTMSADTGTIKFSVYGAHAYAPSPEVIWSGVFSSPTKSASIRTSMKDSLDNEPLNELIGVYLPSTTGTNYYDPNYPTFGSVYKMPAGIRRKWQTVFVSWNPTTVSVAVYDNISISAEPVAFFGWNTIGTLDLSACSYMTIGNHQDGTLPTYQRLDNFEIYDDVVTSETREIKPSFAIYNFGGALVVGFSEDDLTNHNVGYRLKSNDYWFNRGENIYWRGCLHPVGAPNRSDMGPPYVEGPLCACVDTAFGTWADLMGYTEVATLQVLFPKPNSHCAVMFGPNMSDLFWSIDLTTSAANLEAIGDSVFAYSPDMIQIFAKSITYSAIGDIAPYNDTMETVCNNMKAKGVNAYLIDLMPFSLLDRCNPYYGDPYQTGYDILAHGDGVIYGVAQKLEEIFYPENYTPEPTFTPTEVPTPTPTPIYASKAPSDISGLKLWLNPDIGVTSSGNVVSLWADQSGNGNDCWMETEIDKPTLFLADPGRFNGYATISFTARGPDHGTTLSSTASLIADGTAARTLMVLMEPVNAEANAIMDFSPGACNGTHWAVKDTVIYSCGGHDLTGLPSFGNVGGSVYQVYTWTWTGGNPGVLYRYRDKTTISDGINGTDWNIGVGYTIAAWLNNSNDHSTIKVGGVLLFDTVLSDSDREVMVDYLYYGVSPYVPEPISIPQNERYVIFPDQLFQPFNKYIVPPNEVY